MKEKISALLDAELGGPERDKVLSECRKNTELRKLWQRYHLIGAALRKELEIVPQPNLVERIVKNIQDIPSERGQRKFSSLFERSPQRTIFATAFVFLVIVVAPVVMVVPSYLTDSRKQASVTPTTTVPISSTASQEQEWADMLNAFLIEHNELTPISTMNGMMPYVRIAGYDDIRE